jgi:hypothetical protein
MFLSLVNIFVTKISIIIFSLVDQQVCNNEKDEKCIQQRTQFEQINDICTSENIQFAISTNIQIAEKQFNIYGSLPKLCFFRDGFPVIYTGKREREFVFK